MAHVTALERAAVLAVGSELLTPLRSDTNSLFITEQLNLLGIEVVLKTIVGDDRHAISGALGGALSLVDLVVCTGGLGPTDDDVTREAVAGLFGLPLVEDERQIAAIEARFAARGLEMPEINRRQAMVPAGARILENAHGTAPGLWLETGDRVVVLLPGPPRELEPMLIGLVRGALSERRAGMSLVRKVVRVTGRTESHTEEALRPLYARWVRMAPPVSATILAALGQIELHLTARARSSDQADTSLARASREAIETLGLDAYSDDGRTLEDVLGTLLIERRWRIAVAESCTGGLITSRLTDVAGSSRYVERGVVVYADEAKTSLLGVPAALIQAHGAVSEAVARAMAEAVRDRSNVDVGVGVTGIAGPGGGTPDKPVGTVAIAAVVPGDIHCRTFQFIGDRRLVKNQAAQAALDMVRRMILSPRRAGA